MPALSRRQKITFAELHEQGVRGVLVFAAATRSR